VLHYLFDHIGVHQVNDQQSLMMMMVDVVYLLRNYSELHREAEGAAEEGHSDLSVLEILEHYLDGAK
jgi:hypothetical protein